MKNKTFLAILLAAIMVFTLTACTDKPDTSSGDTSSDTSSVTEPKETPVTLYANFAAGNEQANELGLIKTKTVNIKGDITPEQLASELSAWSGLDFTLNAMTVETDKVTVDWAKTSTLVAGLDDRAQKEEFFFYDFDSLCWFMMDSLWQTVLENMGVSEVYYTMDGGKDLVIENFASVEMFPKDVPYMGSPFYAAHSDVVGDEDVFSKTYGRWYYNGESDGAYIEMDGKGCFEWYLAEGSLNYEGYLEYVDEYEDGNGRYDMYDPAGEWLEGFYFDSENSFHFGNDADFSYIRANTEQADPLPEPAALIPGYRFTDTTALEQNNDYNGGYYYKDQTEDGLSDITNCCFATVWEENDNLTDYLHWVTEEICGSEPKELNWAEDAALTGKFTYPVWILDWKTGGAEDTRIYDGVFFMTDTHTYLYAFSTTADNHPEMKEVWQDVFSMLELQ